MTRPMTWPQARAQLTRLGFSEDAIRETSEACPGPGMHHDLPGPVTRHGLDGGDFTAGTDSGGLWYIAGLPAYPAMPASKPANERKEVTMNTPVTTTTWTASETQGWEVTTGFLSRLGYDEGAIRQAMEHADFTVPQDPPSFLSRHTVVGVPGGYQVIEHPEPPAPWPDLTRDRDIGEILAAIRIVDQHLDDAAPEIYKANPLANRWRRVTKVCEESGEVWDALSRLTGDNPRKGTDPDGLDRVLGELGDIITAGMLGIQSVTKDTDVTWAVFIAALAKALGRVPQGRPAPAATGTVEGCPGCFVDEPRTGGNPS